MLLKNPIIRGMKIFACATRFLRVVQTVLKQMSDQVLTY